MRKILILISLLTTPAFAAEYGKVTTQKVSEGVYLFVTTPYGVGLSGNSVAIVSKHCVLIFDSNGLPQTAETILSEVRKITNAPVQYLINSHWHWDHWAGNQIYRAAFPALQIITHEKTRTQMMEVEPRWNDQGLKHGLPAYIKQMEEGLQKAKSAGSSATVIRDREELIQAAKNFLNQKTALVKTYPDVTFQGAITLYDGEHPIEIRHARAITVGDTYAYLPQEKILITGDILLSPYPYAIGGSYPSDWLKTLEDLAALQPAMLIPGHGAPQTSEFLRQNIQLFRTVLQQVKDSRNAKSSLDDTKSSIGKGSKELAAILGISDAQVVEEFKAYFLDVFVARAYKELETPLGDLPDGLPE